MYTKEETALLVIGTKSELIEIGKEKENYQIYESRSEVLNLIKSESKNSDLNSNENVNIYSFYTLEETYCLCNQSYDFRNFPKSENRTKKNNLFSSMRRESRKVEKKTEFLNQYKKSP